MPLDYDMTLFLYGNAVLYVIGTPKIRKITQNQFINYLKHYYYAE